MAASPEDISRISSFDDEVIRGVFAPDHLDGPDDRWEEFGTPQNAAVARAALERAHAIREEKGVEAAQAYLQGVVDRAVLEQRQEELDAQLASFDPNNELQQLITPAGEA